MYSAKIRFLMFLSLCCISVAALSETPVRIATYNIKFLNDDVGGERLDKLKSVIDLLEADVIALQEIDDRAALEKIFDKNDWHLVIDEDSGVNQDVAVAIRKAWTLVNIPADLDADDEHFLFSGVANNNFFPNRRDVLHVHARFDGDDIHIFVIHAKSRFGGRDVTEDRRVGAARALVSRIRVDFDDVPFVLLGDFNDNPDDQSLNILESGLDNQSAGPEQIRGPFLINVTEPLVVGDHVSWGLKSDAVTGEHLDTVTVGSRDINNAQRGTSGTISDILFDQILIPAWMDNWYVPDSASVFEFAVAARGNNSTRASDHVPVYADFVLRSGDAPAPASAGIRISSLLPNPQGTDNNHEEVTLANSTSSDVDLAGWVLRDLAGNEYALEGALGSGASRVITLQRGAMLNNMGDEVWLIDSSGEIVSHRVYSASDAQSGMAVIFN